PEFLPAELLEQTAAPDRDTGATSPVARSAAPVSRSDDWERYLEEQLRGDPRDLYSRWQEVTDRFLLERVLRHTRGNQLRAARLLGVGRATLRAKIRALGINLAAAEESDGDEPREE